MLVTSQLLIQTTKIFYSCLTCTCAPHFQKASATHDPYSIETLLPSVLTAAGQ